MRRLGRSQKYHARQRHLYALLFENGCAYIGQSVDPQERERQHRRPTGGWCGREFRFVHLGVIEGTEAQACDFEHAWRHRAAVNGWTIYAKPPGMEVNHRRQMNLRRYLIAWTLRWPAKHSRNLSWRMAKGAAVVCVIGMFGWLFLYAAIFSLV